MFCNQGAFAAQQAKENISMNTNYDTQNIAEFVNFQKNENYIIIEDVLRLTRASKKYIKIRKQGAKVDTRGSFCKLCSIAKGQSRFWFRL